MDVIDEEKLEPIADDEIDWGAETFSHIFKEKHCVCCKKVFCRMDWASYVYKISCAGGYRYFCSWTCMQKWRREHTGKQKTIAVATDKEIKKKPKYIAKEAKRSKRRF